MNKLARYAGLVAILSAFGLPAYADHRDGHFKGVFEAPMMDGTVVVAGSEGKIGEFGDFKVEIPIEAVAENTDFKICLRFADALGGAARDLFVQTVTVLMGEDELKAEGDLSLVLTAPNLWRPAFRVFTGGTAETCDGVTAFESGTTIADFARQ